LSPGRNRVLPKATDRIGPGPVGRVLRWKKHSARWKKSGLPACAAFAAAESKARRAFAPVEKKQVPMLVGAKRRSRFIGKALLTESRRRDFKEGQVCIMLLYNSATFKTFNKCAAYITGHYVKRVSKANEWTCPYGGNLFLYKQMPPNSEEAFAVIQN